MLSNVTAPVTFVPKMVTISPGATSPAPRLWYRSSESDLQSQHAIMHRGPYTSGRAEGWVFLHVFWTGKEVRQAPEPSGACPLLYILQSIGAPSSMAYLKKSAKPRRLSRKASLVLSHRESWVSWPS